MNTEHHQRTLPVPSDRAIRVVVALIILSILTGLVFVVARVYVLGQNDQDQTEEIGELRGTNAAQDQALKEANERLSDAGQPTVDVPDTPAPAEAAEVSPSMLESALATLCGDCRGHAGATGAAGLTGKRGPRGVEGPASTVPGPRGPAGADSTVPGPRGADGPPGPGCVEEVGLAQCQGPKGEQGEPGQDGSNGAPGVNGQDGTAQPGSYSCPEGQTMTGFTITAGGGVVLDCTAPLLPRR